MLSTYILYVTQAETILLVLWSKRNFSIDKTTILDTGMYEYKVTN